MEAALTLETSRYQALGALRTRFDELTVRPGYLSDQRWGQHFEQWLWARKLDQQAAKRKTEEAYTDMVLPSGLTAREDPELRRKLIANGAEEEEAARVCERLGARCNQLVVRLSQLHSTLQLREEHIPNRSL